MPADLPRLEDLRIDARHAGVGARRLQRSDHRRSHRRRPAHHQRAAHDQVAARPPRGRGRVRASRTSGGQARPAVLDGSGRGPPGRAARLRSARSRRPSSAPASTRSWRRRRPATSSCSRTCDSIPARPTATPAFCTNLADLADVYVNEAFGASHRESRVDRRASARVLPHAGGRLLVHEVEVLSGLLDAAEASLRRGARRREGRRQARRDRGVARPLRHRARRRRDGVHVPARAGQAASATRSCSPTWSTSAVACSKPGG